MTLNWLEPISKPGWRREMLGKMNVALTGQRGLKRNVDAMMNSQHVVAVSDSSQIGEARRDALRIASALGLNETDAGHVGIAVTELATNLSRYATRGEILLQSSDLPSGKRVDIISLDRGPGMADVQKCLQDGYSTGGTSGTGLGAVRRVSNAFDIYSTQPAGTVVFASVWDRPPGQTASRQTTWAGISRAVATETRCGDGWSLVEQDGRLAIIVADGLGYGPLASDAAQEACKVFNRAPFASSTAILQEAHTELRGMRGAAVSIAQFNSANGSLKYAGIGNICGKLVAIDNSPSQGLTSVNGTVGVQLNKLREFEYSSANFPLLILHSDGLQSRWSLDSYPGLASRHPGVIAGILYRDFKRDHDDATVVVMRWRKPRGAA